MALPLGKVYGTMGAVVAFARALDEDMNIYLARHARGGDDGELSESDRQANEHALKHGLRVLSAYTLTHRRENLDYHRGRPQQDDDSCCPRNTDGYPAPPERHLGSEQEIAVAAQRQSGAVNLEHGPDSWPMQALKTRGGGRGSEPTTRGPQAAARV
jgi:hypothetical protein